MNGFVALTTRARIRVLTALAVAVVALAALPGAASAFTQADVDASIAKGVTYFDANQNADGSWGTSVPGAETALALASYGVFDGNSFAKLSPAQQTRVQNGLTFLLGTQGVNGGFNKDGLATYDTGLALIALSLSSDVPTTTPGAVAIAIANGRSYLTSHQNVPPNGGISCQSTGANGSGLGGQQYCGGWDYTGPDTRSDVSNTGFALTGLDLTGGVPAGAAAANSGYMRNVQQLTANPGGFTARNDGGGAYEPGISSGDFSSNANDTGSLLFGFGYDGVPGTDPAVQAAIKFGNDVFDTYELNKANRTMVFHTAQNEDGACDITVAGCTWAFGTGEGGYHYSMFALVKGLGQYITPNLNDPTNFYAKAGDLLLTQQNADGSWPEDPRDDGTIFGATGFAILALGRVGTPPLPPTPPTPTPTTTPTPTPVVVVPGKAKLSVSGLRTACVSQSFTARVTIKAPAGIKKVSVYIDGKRVLTSTKSSIRVPVSLGRLKAGRHSLKVVAVDKRNRSTTTTRSFFRCARKAAKRQPPRFTG